MRVLLGLLLIVSMVFMAVSCSGSDPDVASLEFSSADIVDGELALAKDGSVLIGVVARDPAGNEVEINASDLEWTSSNPEVVEVHGLGTAALLTGLRDWFDSAAPPCPSTDAGVPDGGTGGTDGADGCPEGGAGGADGGAPPDGGAGGDDVGPTLPHEPSAELTVRYRGDITATITMRVVLSAAGRWRAIIDDGKLTQDMTLEQDGRRVTYTGTTGNANGLVRDDHFTLMQLGFTLDGTFVSRMEVRGTYAAADGSSGVWVATRLP